MKSNFAKGGSSSPLSASRTDSSCGELDAKKSAPSAPNLTSSAERSIHLTCLLITFFLGSCVAPDAQHRVVISTREQRLAVLDRGNLLALYPVSTSKFGLGDWPRSCCTPLGKLEIAQKIGDGAPPGAVFKDRRRTGEIVASDSPGRDPIVTRILWLRGRQPQNANAFRRDIYIHGTPEERNIGLPVSYGCIRMRSRDIINLYDIVGLGAEVTIVDAPLAAVVPGLSSGTQMAATNSATMVIR